MSETLKPCAHCGKPVTVSEGMGEYWIYCPCQEGSSIEADAIEAWNRRAAPAIPASLIDRYRLLLSRAGDNWSATENRAAASELRETLRAMGCDLRELEKQQ